MEQKNSLSVQQARISDEEKDLLRGLFLDNEPLLIAVRNLFFGFDLSTQEKEWLKVIKTPEQKRLLRKIFLPELQPDLPIGQSIDLWMTIKLGDAGKDEEIMESRRILLDNLEKALKLLDNPTGRKVDLSVVGLESAELQARNTFIGHVEMQLQAIRAMANEKKETQEERSIRLLKDSVK